MKYSEIKQKIRSLSPHTNPSISIGNFNIWVERNEEIIGMEKPNKPKYNITGVNSRFMGEF